MQAIGCSSGFTSGAPWIGMRGSRSPCKPRARNFSPQGSMAVPGEDECSSVDYDEVATQWLSADFLDLRLRSSGLICNEAIQALRSHFQKTDERLTASDDNSMPSTAVQHSLEDGAPIAYQGNGTRSLPNVVVLDENFFLSGTTLAARTRQRRAASWTSHFAEASDRGAFAHCG